MPLEFNGYESGGPSIRRTITESDATELRMNDVDEEKELLDKYPLHIVLMVKAAKNALAEGRARIVDGVLVIDTPKPPELDRQRLRNVES